MSEQWYKVCKTAIDSRVTELTQRTEDAERKAAAGEEFCRLLSEERDGLLEERDSLLQTLRESAATLTKVDTQGMETNEILKKVRAEKEEVEHRKGALEMDLAYLHARIQQMDEELGEYATSLEAKGQSERNLQAKLDAELNNNAALSDQLMRREEQIQDLKRRLSGRDENIESLNHALDTKTRQLHVIIKERDRLRSEKELSAKKVLIHTKRPANIHALNSSLNNSGMASPVSQIDVSRVDNSNSNNNVSMSSPNTSMNTTLDTTMGSPSPVASSSSSSSSSRNPEAFSIKDNNESPSRRKKIMLPQSKTAAAQSYANMTTVLRAIEETWKVELDHEQVDPISWLHQEHKEQAPASDTKLKMYKVIIAKQEEEIRRLKTVK
jgi:hypothetical protein